MLIGAITVIYIGRASSEGCRSIKTRPKVIPATIIWVNKPAMLLHLLSAQVLPMQGYLESSIGRERVILKRVKDRVEVSSKLQCTFNSESNAS